MGKLVVLTIVEGDFERGFPVLLGIATEGEPHFAEAEGKLPPALYIRDHYKSWQSPYLNLVNSLRSSARISVTGETVSIAHIKAATKKLESSLNKGT